MNIYVYLERLSVLLLSSTFRSGTNYFNFHENRELPGKDATVALSGNGSISTSIEVIPLRILARIHPNIMPR